MPRRRKALVDLVRDGTFLARKDERLLAGRDELPWPRLEDYRTRYRAGGGRDVALELERALRGEDAQAKLLGELQRELRRCGPPGSFRQLDRFAQRFFRHQKGSLASPDGRWATAQPYVFPPNHRAFLKEFWRRDKHGRRVYQVGLLMEPKGCSKTPTAAVLGTHAVCSETDAPSVFQIAGSKDQAGFGHEFAQWNVQQGPLAAWLEIAGGALLVPEHWGEFEILSAEGDLSAGANPLAGLFDELFLFRHRHQREAWNSQAQALHKRSGRSWVLGISTAGYDKQTLLGEMYDAAVAHPKLEVRDGGYHLRLRDVENGFLFWCHEIPLDADIQNPAVIRKGTPAPWVDPGDLLRELGRPDVDELDWRRLHGNQWTRARSAWIPSRFWAPLRGETEIPDGARVIAGVDAARTHDTTAISWGWLGPDGRLVLRSHVWSVRQEAPHHTFVHGGELANEELVEPFIRALADRYELRAIGFDPRYFTTEARHLSEDGFLVIEIQPGSAAMGDAVVAFEKAVLAGRIEHDGDRVLAAHIEAIDADRRPDGSKKVGKRSDAYPIDAGMASVICNYISTLDLPESVDEPGFAWV
jgi:phage terminase large subunit-like protein